MRYAAIAYRRPGPHQLQAAIAATHARAATADVTHWSEIAASYAQLVRLSPTPVVALNHGVAVAMAEAWRQACSGWVASGPSVYLTDTASITRRA
jgi:predicted RNA polymerase sigma factor